VPKADEAGVRGSAVQCGAEFLFIYFSILSNSGTPVKQHRHTHCNRTNNFLLLYVLHCLPMLYYCPKSKLANILPQTGRFFKGRPIPFILLKRIYFTKMVI
jgi:hypothetical protein